MTMSWPFPSKAQGGTEIDPQDFVRFASHALGAKHPVHCGLSVHGLDGLPETLAATDDVAIRADWLQRELRRGPTVEQSDRVVLSNDLGNDKRWADFGPLCQAVIGMRAALTVQAPTSGSNLATLSFYAPVQGGFDKQGMATAVELAQYARLCAEPVMDKLFGGSMYTGAGHLAIALGLVMGRYRLPSAEAFQLLADTAISCGITLFVLALEVERTGRLPQAARGRGDTSQAAPTSLIQNAPVES
jgi:hypothetical protein